MAISGNACLSQRRQENYSKKVAGEPPNGGSPPPNTDASDSSSQTKLNEIYRFSRHVSAIHSVETLLQCIVKETTAILEVSYSQVFLVQPDGAWVCEATYPAPAVIENQSRPVATGMTQLIYQQAAQKVQPTILRRGNSFWITLERQKPFTSRSSCLCLVPLAFARETLGLLVMGLVGDSRSIMDDEKTQLAAFLAEQAAGALYRVRMTNRLQESQSEAVLALSKTIQARDDPTGSHSARMTSLAGRTAAALGCSQDEIEIIHRAGLLHDIGKISVPDEILHRPGPLTEEEWVLIRRHPDVGAEIVLMVSNLSTVADLVRSHHERYDGKGYPRGLKEDSIPLGGRILAITDAYTTMTDGRTYRTPITHADTIAELVRCSGSHFDPKVVEAFLSLFH
jgi:putative nucleotidyltransferase with HDIG domain